MTGDKVEKATMVFGKLSDFEMAVKVRMLFRDQLDHEAVCCGARDRIMYLSQHLETAEAERDRYKVALEEIGSILPCSPMDGWHCKQRALRALAEAVRPTDGALTPKGESI